MNAHTRTLTALLNVLSIARNDALDDTASFLAVEIDRINTGKKAVGFTCTYRVHPGEFWVEHYNDALTMLEASYEQGSSLSGAPIDAEFATRPL